MPGPPRDHLPIPRNMQPKFIRAIQTLSQVRGALARLANELPPMPEGEGYVAFRFFVPRLETLNSLTPPPPHFS
jgi:hypothetical protein